MKKHLGPFLSWLFLFSLFLFHFNFSNWLYDISCDSSLYVKLMAYLSTPRTFVYLFSFDMRVNTICSLIETLFIYAIHGIGMVGALQYNKRKTLISAWTILGYILALILSRGIKHGFYFVISEFVIGLLMLLIILLARGLNCGKPDVRIPISAPSETIDYSSADMKTENEKESTNHYERLLAIGAITRGEYENVMAENQGRS